MKSSIWRSIVWLLLVLPVFQGRAQGVAHSNLHLSFSSDVFLVKTVKYAPGFKLGYQFNFSDSLRFIRLSYHFAFGNGKNGLMEYYNPDPIQVERDYSFAAGTIMASYHQFFNGGSMWDHGWFWSAGAGAVVNNIDFEDIQYETPFGNTTITKRVHGDYDYVMFGLMAGVGYYYSWEKIAVFAEGNLIASMGGNNSWGAMERSKLYQQYIRPVFNVGMAFTIHWPRNFRPYAWGI